jgi:hypothetical protein
MGTRREKAKARWLRYHPVIQIKVCLTYCARQILEHQIYKHSTMLNPSSINPLCVPAATCRALTKSKATYANLLTLFSPTYDQVQGSYNPETELEPFRGVCISNSYFIGDPPKNTHRHSKACAQSCTEKQEQARAKGTEWVQTEFLPIP